MQTSQHCRSTKKAPPVPSKSKILLEYLNTNSTLTECSEIELEPADSKHALPAKPSGYVSFSDAMSEKWSQILHIRIGINTMIF